MWFAVDNCVALRHGTPRAAPDAEGRTDCDPPCLLGQVNGKEVFYESAEIKAASNGDAGADGQTRRGKRNDGLHPSA